MDLNRGVIKSFKPFRWNEKVRFSWDEIVLMNRVVIMLIRKFIDQKGAWMMNRINRFRIINRGEGKDELKDAGSKEEKISLIIGSKYGFDHLGL